MTFISLSFMIFLPLVVAAYFICPTRWRWALLLAASCYFYMAFVPAYILVLFALIAIDYIGALLIERSEGRSRTMYLVLCIVGSVGLLFFFKYFDFFNGNVAALAHLLDWNYSIPALKLLWPLGLSFHTFQSLSYVIEVYRGTYKAERHLGVYALYVMFFPQLVAGPIERPAQLIPQLKNPRSFDYSNAVEGLQMILWGFFKKVVIADNLGVMVDFIYAHSATADGSVIALAVAAFAVQLYADFSAYSDIAIGSAKMLGIDLVQNFRQPFFSRSVAEFWRRWHISLSSWFRDYVYTPLLWQWRAGGRIAEFAVIMITFVLVGFWHGPAWTFIVMGAIFGTYIALGSLTKRIRDALLRPFPQLLRSWWQVLITYCLVAVAFVFFRAPSLGAALDLLHTLVTRWGSGAFAFLRCSDYCSVYAIGIGRKELLAVGVAVLALFIYEYIQQVGITVPAWLDRRLVRWSAYYALILCMLLMAHFIPRTFIYFQF
ncbi:MAG: MBOAT family O-acyltransferase [Patescibacteria group bacterium]